MFLVQIEDLAKIVAPHREFSVAAICKVQMTNRPCAAVSATNDVVGSDINGAHGALVRAKSKKASDVDRFLHPR